VQPLQDRTVFQNDVGVYVGESPGHPFIGQAESLRPDAGFPDRIPSFRPFASRSPRGILQRHNHVNAVTIRIGYRFVGEITRFSMPWMRIACLVVAIGIGSVVFVRHQRATLEKLPTSADAPETTTAYGCIESEPFAAATSVTLIDATDELGLDFVHVVGPLGSYYVPESVGSGAAWCDFDDDGILDLLMINGERSPGTRGELPPSAKTDWRLYRGTSEGTLIEVTDAGLADLGFGMGCAVGDVDNDGDPDVYVTCVGQDRLLLNDGNFRFHDVAEKAGISETEWGTGVSLFDYDRDGLLDLIVANYTQDKEYDHQVACGINRDLVSYCGPHKFAPTVDRLYHNEGLRRVLDSGELVPDFRDVTEAAGMSQVTSFGFAAVTVDLTGDDWPDILIANDGQPNRFWVNGQDGTFTEEAVQRGLALNQAGAAEAGMGIAVGDIDRNQTLDLVMTHLSSETTTLYLNGGDGFFHDGTLPSGLARTTMSHTGWGAVLVDLDHDGWLDLPMVHGLVIPCHSGFAPHGEDRLQVRYQSIVDDAAYWRDYADQNLLMMSTGSAILRDGTIDDGGDFTRAVGSARCLLYGDPDEDGDLDLLVTNSGSPARFYRNEFPKLGHWIRFRLVDDRTRRDAIGARIRIECGENSWTSVVAPCTSFLASHDLRVHFGLGDQTSVDRIVVFWPDGPVEECAEVFAGGPVDRDRTLRRGTGTGMRTTP